MFKRAFLASLISRSILFGSILLMLSNTVSAELIGHWPFDEGAGDSTADMSASGTTGLISNVDTGGPDGGSVWVNDPVRGSVLGFGGGADSAYVRAGDIPVMTLENDFTWAFWANHHPDTVSYTHLTLPTICSV